MVRLHGKQGQPCIFCTLVISLAYVSKYF